MPIRWLRLGITLGITVALAACASGGTAGPGSGGRTDVLQNYDPGRAAVATRTGEFATIYDAMGLAASGPPLFFVGDVGYFATSSPDTTLVVVGLSLPNRGLVFKRDQTGYSASYAVDLSITGSTGIVAQARDSESVRVPTFKETSRTDESVIYRRALRVAPGSYSLTYAVRDGGGQRSGERSLSIAVPRLARPGLSTLEPVYEAQPRLRLDSVPAYLPAPRASYVFGVNDSASVYMESYSPGTPISVEVRTPDGKTAWQGSRTLPARGPSLASGIVTVPLSHADVGIGTIVAALAGSADTVGTRMFIGFGPDLPVLSFREMLGYLRFFRAPGKVQPLYNARPEERGARWAEFLRATDPNPDTPQNEALDDYFGRIRDANSIFVTDSPRGWLSDRGEVFVTLGAPSNAYEDYGSMYMGDFAVQGQLATRVRILVWEYSQYQSRIIFYDPNDTRQWRLTRPSMAVFQSLLARATNR
jgi:GWxTD domain-containing protein